MASTKLTCPAVAPCEYTTKEVELQMALKLLKMHRDIAHNVTTQAQNRKTRKISMSINRRGHHRWRLE